MVPHSGNACSGMCVAPCSHLDCWQCGDMSDSKAIDAAMKADKARIAKLAALTKPVPEKVSILAAMSGRPDPGQQSTTITRAILETLCERAGIAMSWNNGSPIFKDSGVSAEMAEVERRYASAERKVLEEKVKELDRIVKQQEAGSLTAQAANSMAKAASQQMDTMVNDILKDKVEATLRADVVANEARIRADLKSKGATDADIDAAVKLMGWKEPKADAFLAAAPPQDDFPGWLAGLDKELSTVAGLNDLLQGSSPALVASSAPLTGDAIRRMVEQMQSHGVVSAGPGSSIAIVHPSALSELGVSDYQSEMDRIIKAKIAATLEPDLHIGWKARIKGVFDA